MTFFFSGPGGMDVRCWRRGAVVGGRLRGGGVFFAGVGLEIGVTRRIGCFTYDLYDSCPDLFIYFIKALHTFYIYKSTK